MLGAVGNLFFIAHNYPLPLLQKIEPMSKELLIKENL
jgi:hypothetical protein